MRPMRAVAWCTRDPCATGDESPAQGRLLRLQGDAFSGLGSRLSGSAPGEQATEHVNAGGPSGWVRERAVEGELSAIQSVFGDRVVK